MRKKNWLPLLFALGTSKNNPGLLNKPGLFKTVNLIQDDTLSEFLKVVIGRLTLKVPNQVIANA